MQNPMVWNDMDLILISRSTTHPSILGPCPRRCLAFRPSPLVRRIRRCCGALLLHPFTFVIRLRCRWRPSSHGRLRHWRPLRRTRTSASFSITWRGWRTTRRSVFHKGQERTPIKDSISGGWGGCSDGSAILTNNSRCATPRLETETFL